MAQRFFGFVNGVRTLIAAITASSGVTDANKIVATDSTGRLALTLMPTGIGPNTRTIPASEALEAGDFVNIWLDAGTVKVRKADNSNNRPARGFVLSAVALSANAQVYMSGENTSLTGLSVENMPFLGTAGKVVSVPPTTANSIIQELGFITSPSSVAFEYDGYILIA